MEEEGEEDEERCGCYREVEILKFNECRMVRRMSRRVGILSALHPPSANALKLRFISWIQFLHHSEVIVFLIQCVLVLLHHNNCQRFTFYPVIV